MIPHEEVSARILALAGESPSKTISGGSLSELLKHTFPGFSVSAYGTKNLRAFIRDHLLGRLNEVGRVGTDIVYGLPGVTPPQTQLTPTSNNKIAQDVSRVFRSPNAPFELHAHRDTGVLKVVEMGAPVPDGWVRIKPASPDAHKQIARNFASGLSDEHRAYLTRILDEYPNAWWPKFSIYVQEKNLYRQWLAFKGNQLRLMLGTELTSLGVMRAGMQEFAPTKETKQQEPEPRPDAIGDNPPPYDDLRDAIVRVVQGLPLSELRGLRLPVGEVYDALKHRN